MTAFVAALLAIFVSVAGLTVDGGRLVATRIELLDHAENAARVGVQNVTSLRSGNPRVDVDRARAAAEQYLRLHGVGGAVEAFPEVVKVRASRVVPLTILSVIGLGSRLVAVERSATPVPGP